MSGPEEAYLNLLLFTVKDVHFGIDAEQVAAVTVYDGEPDQELRWFHRELGYSDDAIVYLAPVIMTIKTKGEEPYRVIIDGMEEIAPFSQNDIRLFPPLMEPFALRRGMWGILPRKGKPVLLVDMLRLLKERCSGITIKPFKDEGTLS